MKRLSAIFRGLADSRAILVLFGLALGAAAVVALGVFTDTFDSGTDSSAQSEEEKTKQLVSERDRARFGDDAVENAFLNFWSDLQFLDFNSAVETYDPRLVEFIGGRRVEEALKLQRGLFVKSKPEIIRVRERGKRATVRYTVVDLDGELTPNTVTWIKDDGEWRILYDSLLDKLLTASAQTTAQKRINPDPKAPPAKQAIAAGEAASRLQRRFLEQLEDEQQQRERQKQQEQQQEQQAPGTEGGQPGVPQGQ